MNSSDIDAPIEIVCGTDANYAPHLGVLLRSILATNPGITCRVHVLHDEVPISVQDKVAACVPSMCLVWYPLVEHRVLQFKPLLQISRATYLRLAMTEMIPATIRRILYLDVDMVVNDSLMPLWQSSLGEGMLCAAVVDPGVDPRTFALKYSLPPSGRYFNAGVMLLDLDAVRAEGLLLRAAELLAAPGADYEYADQDALNVVLWLHWQELDPRWNFQRKFLYDDGAAWRALAPARSSRPGIIHYTEQYKPWRADEWHPYAWLYLKTLLHTPFRVEVLRKGKIGWRHGIKWWLRSIIKRPMMFG